MTPAYETILGIKFYVGDLEGLLRLCDEGNFVVVPAAPGLATLDRDQAYREALEQSDLAITDSSLMLFVWRLMKGRHLMRISGLKLLREILAGKTVRRPGASFWIMPSARETAVNLAWFRREGYAVTEDDCYIAPVYPVGPLEDAELLARLEQRRPELIVINLGGGAQERLGWYLRQKLSRRATILCTGAAIAFITGTQAAIPVWADAWQIGWVLRCLDAPGRFVPRYVKALRLVPLLLKHGARSVR